MKYLFLLLLMCTPAHADYRLDAKAHEIVATCGSRVISGYRHTHVRGTRVWSCHASNEAIDITRNPGCIYQHLQDWPGGYSIDYGVVGHVHISDCPQEWGRHFVHGGHGHHHVHVHRHHSRHHSHRHHHSSRRLSHHHR